jgi:hypothetical protein
MDGCPVTAIGGSTPHYFDAINAGNLKAAGAIYPDAEHSFTAQDSTGNEYSLEYLFYNYDDIYGAAEKVFEHGLYQTGARGTTVIEDRLSEMSLVYTYTIDYGK